MDNITFVWVGDDSHIQENYSLSFIIVIKTAI